MSETLNACLKQLCCGYIKEKRKYDKSLLLVHKHRGDCVMVGVQHKQFLTRLQHD